MPKKTGLKLFTNTWISAKDTEKDNTRPLTATLEKPTILDINLIGKLDMSVVRKEFLNISNLCKVPALLNDHYNLNICTKINKPFKLLTSDRRRETFTWRKKKQEESNDDSWEDNESTNIQSARQSKSLKLKEVKLESAVKKIPKLLRQSDPNKSLLKAPRKGLLIPANVKVNRDQIRRSTKAMEMLPEPCKTCGRPDQPERFHSHPVTPLKPLKKIEPDQLKPPVKNSVQKPMAIKYKSKSNSTQNKSCCLKKTSILSQKPSQYPITNIPSDDSKNPSKMERIKSAKRTLTCYICGREFGTASLGLHEPKCLEKWQRENDGLPSGQKRKLPSKPNENLKPEEWNKQAWESFQSTLTPCLNCGRTFHPDRLTVHIRSCKKSPNRNPQPQPFVGNSRIFEKNSTMRKPSLQPCYICGKLFTVTSKIIHEPHCLKMWKIENQNLPMQKRNMELTKPILIINEGKIDLEATNEVAWLSHLSQLVPCKFCSRTFNPDRVEVHERSCKGY